MLLGCSHVNLSGLIDKRHIVKISNINEDLMHISKIYYLEIIQPWKPEKKVVFQESNLDPILLSK